MGRRREPVGQIITSSRPDARLPPVQRRARNRRGGRMPGTTRAAAVGQEGNLSGSNVTLVVIVGVVALLALAMGFVFRRQVLAAGEGTENMRTIARAVQEGA